MRRILVVAVKVFVLVGFLLGLLGCSLFGDDEPDHSIVQEKMRFVFLGDSITQSGGYINYIEQYVRAQYPKREFEFLNLGLSSETVSGLSEADHPFPRPDVHERLERVLKRTKPDVVVACYGMNCGVYAPFDEERFAAYQAGMRSLVKAAQKRGIRMILVTPPPFSPKPGHLAMLQKNMGPDYGFRMPYADYNAVLQEYGKWVQDLGKELDILTIDLYEPLSRHQESSYGSDPIHPNAFGHMVMAKALLEQWGAEELVDEVVLDGRSGKVIQGEVSDFRVVDGSVRFSWKTHLPMVWNSELRGVTVEDKEMLGRFNQHRLSLVGSEYERYVLYEGGDKIGELTAKQLETGVNLGLEIEGLDVMKLSSNRRAADLYKLIALRHSIYDYALLNDIGHKRPNAKAIEIDEAEEKAEQLEQRISTLSQPITMSLRLDPIRDEENK